jgi:hypothetical protein
MLVVPVRSAEASLTQTAFQFRSDDGVENIATNLGGLNTPITWPLNSALRARMQVTSAVATTTPFFLQYRKSTDSRWDTVGVSGTTPNIMATSSGQTNADTSAHTITLPSCAAGNVLLVLFSYDGTAVAVTSSLGWNKLGQRTNGTVVSSAVFWRYSSGADALTVSTSAAEGSSHIVYCIQNAGAPSGTGADGSSTNSNPPNHPTGAARNYLVIATRSGDDVVVASAPPASFSSMITVTSATTTGASSNAAQVSSTTASIDPGVFTSATEQWVSWTITVPPVHTPTPGSSNFAEGKAPTTGENNTGVGSIAWSSPGNALTSNNGRATLTVSSTTASNYLFVTGYGFNIPAHATITGVEAQIERVRTGGTSGEVRDSTVRLVKGGSVVGSNLGATGTNWPTSELIATYGGVANMWGTTWTSADINASNFGIAISVAGAAVGANRIANIDHVVVNVYYTLPSPVGLAPSTHIANGGASTTAWMQAPIGLTTSAFDAGRIADDTNPSPSVTIGTNRYSEFEWNVLATGTAATGDIYYLRLANSLDGSFATYSSIAEWTIGRGVNIVGQLFGEDGVTPLSGRTVVAAVGTSTPSRHSTTTATDGSFSITSIATSTGGRTWTGVSNPETITAITYGNGRFVTVGNNGDDLLYSNDGITWNAVANPQNNIWSDVTYGNGKFVAVACSFNGFPCNTTAGGSRVMWSENGITWNLASSTENNHWRAITYGNGTFVAVSSNGTNRVMYSTDGITWTATNAASQDGWMDVTYGNGRFVAVGYYDVTGDVMMYSDDGVTWNSANEPNTNTYQAVTYGNGKFVATAISGTNRIAYSTDGINWTAVAAPENNSWDGLTYANGRYVAVSYNGTSRVMYSDNAINWTLASSSNQNGYVDITYGNGRFVAAGYFSANSNVIMYSDAGFGEDTPITLFVDGDAIDATTLTYGVNGATGGFVNTSLASGTVTIQKTTGNRELWLSNADFYDATDDADILLTATTSTTTINGHLVVGRGTTVHAPQNLILRQNFSQLGTFYPERGNVVASSSMAQYWSGTFTGSSSLHQLTLQNPTGVRLPNAYTLTGNYTNTGVAKHDPNSLITLTGTSTFSGTLTGTSSLPALLATSSARVTIANTVTTSGITTSGTARVDASSAGTATIRGTLTNAGTYTAPTAGSLTLTGNLSNPGTLNASTTSFSFQWT